MIHWHLLGLAPIHDIADKPMKIFTRFLLCSLFLFIYSNSARADRDFLWKEIGGVCVPAYKTDDVYGPCAMVNLNDDYAIYKTDDNPSEYLLIPTGRITGIEDVKLQLATEPNRFYDAWQSRGFMTQRLNRPIKEHMISLAVNAANARTQDQLHIHISCLASEARNIIARLPVNQLNGQWSASAVEIAGYRFFYKKLSMDELKKENLFITAKEKVDQEKGTFAYAGIGLVNLDPGNFLLLTGIGTSDRGVAGERLQDHQCLAADQ